MSKIALAFSDTPQTELDYDILNTAVTTSNYKVFDPLEFKILPEVKKQNGRTLTNRAFSHRLGSKNLYQIKVGADELFGGNIEFVEAFHKSNYKYISVGNDDDEFIAYIEVISESELPNIGYVNGIKYLPEYSDTLVEVE